MDQSKDRNGPAETSSPARDGTPYASRDREQMQHRSWWIRRRRRCHDCILERRASGSSKCDVVLDGARCGGRPGRLASGGINRGNRGVAFQRQPRASAIDACGGRPHHVARTV